MCGGWNKMEIEKEKNVSLGKDLSDNRNNRLLSYDRKLQKTYGKRNNFNYIESFFFC